MPRIPKYNSQLSPRTGTLSKQPSAVRVSPEAYGTMGRAVADMGKVIAAVGEKIHQIRIEEESSRASLAWTKAINQREYEASQDQDLNDFQKRHLGNLEKDKQDILKTIKDHNARSKFEIKANQELDFANYNLKRLYNKKSIDNAKIALEQNAAEKARRWYAATTDLERKNIEGEIADSFQTLETKGAYAKGEAALRFKDWKDALQKGKARLDIDKDPVTALNNLNEGKYPGLTPEDRIALKELAEKQLKKRVEDTAIIDLQTQLKAQQDFDERLEADMSISEAIGELEDGIASGFYNEKWANAKKGAILYSGGIDQERQNEFEYDIIMQIADVTEGYTSIKEKKRRRKDAQEYLRGLHNIEVRINEGVASGIMDKNTAKIHLKKLYNATTAEATQKIIAGSFWKYDIKDADEAFKKILPQEQVPEAIRQFFYQTDGKDLKKEELRKIASDIQKDLLTRSRNEVLKDSDLEIEQSAEIPAFASEEEVEKANLPDGTKVRINGKEYIWRK